MSKIKRTRRKRRQAKMHFKSGGKFQVRHKSPSGRTGRVLAKQLAGRH